MQRAARSAHPNKGRLQQTITDISSSPRSTKIGILKRTKLSRAEDSSPMKKKKKVSETGKQSNKKRKSMPEKKISSNLQHSPERQLNSPTNCDYEHRTVNSAIDIAGDKNKNTVTEVIPRKKLKKRKIEPIDSEVELFKNNDSNLLDISEVSLSLKEKQQLNVIQEAMVKSETLKDKSGRNKRKLSNQSSPNQAKVQKPTLKRDQTDNQNLVEKYPILKNEDLVKRFLSVSMTNNQKGRVRQVIRDVLRGTSAALMPDVINNRIQSILKSSENLTDSDLRKIRILYNMLKKATEESPIEKQVTDKTKTENGEKAIAKKNNDNVKTKHKRYVVFVGNLPGNVNKEQILSHFSNLRECIKDVRIPPREEGKKSSIAYLELDNEPSYQLALSQHHSMMGSKRINVLYTAHKNSKHSKAEAKAKGAKLIAMGKKGQLLGSVALNKKRSHRRAKMRQAQKAAEIQRNVQLNRKLLQRPAGLA